jgi:hypothetical protein
VENFKVRLLSRNLPRKAEANCEKPQPEYQTTLSDWNTVLSKYEAGLKISAPL